MATNQSSDCSLVCLLALLYILFQFFHSKETERIKQLDKPFACCVCGCTSRILGFIFLTLLLLSHLQLLGWTIFVIIVTNTQNIGSFILFGLCAALILLNIGLTIASLFTSVQNRRGCISWFIHYFVDNLVNSTGTGHNWTSNFLHT